ncbi:uncharacterized protein L201_001835 [Kwoniella dendrophila CBS 6074]|uniref:Uncharacterized protein n=1 Tax=Kwoniella dendrophila CBS 6074 TaxID=1295534 RepID=A0AAX4JNK5_9TREE
MDKLKKFTWIFWTKNEFYEKWKLTPEDDRCKRRNSILYRSMFHLASVLFGLKDTVDITIVNSGCLQELEWRILSPMELQIQTKIGIGRGLGFAARRQYIAQRLPDVPRSEAEKRDQVRAKSRSEDIQCRTMIEYLNSIHWQDVFEKDEVKHWIKV